MLAESDVNINNRQKPMKRFCDDSHVSKTKDTV